MVGVGGFVWLNRPCIIGRGRWRRKGVVIEGRSRRKRRRRGRGRRRGGFSFVSLSKLAHFALPDRALRRYGNVIFLAVGTF